ncbi:hypothetical protein PMIN03_001587 [Paraphaeosphaeria minitans]
MDIWGARPDRKNKRASAYLERIFPVFDQVDLIRYTDEAVLDGIPLKAMDNRSYKVHFATNFADKEDLFTYLKRNCNRDQDVKVAFFSIEKGQCPTSYIEELLFMRTDGHTRLAAWLPRNLRSDSTSRALLKLITVIKAALVYKGAFGDSKAIFGRNFGEVMAEVCRALPRVYFPSSPLTTSLSLPSTRAAPTASGSTDRRLINPAKTISSGQDTKPPTSSFNSSDKAEEVWPSVLSPGGSTAVARLSPARSSSLIYAGIMPSTPAVQLAPNFVASLEAAERAKHAAQNKLSLMHEHLQRLDDRIETYEQKLIRRKQEGDLLKKIWRTRWRFRKKEL